MTKIKIAIIGSAGIPPRFGGFDTFVFELSKRIDKLSNVSIIVYGETTKSLHIIRDEYVGIKRVSVPRIGRIGVIINRILGIRDAVYNEKVNVIYLLGYSSAFFINWKQIKRNKIKFIINPDGLEWRRTKFSFLMRKFLKTSERIVMHNSDIIVADSLKIGEYIKNVYGRNYIYIPYGVDLTDQNHIKEVDLLKTLGLSFYSYYIIVSRCVSENNILMMIEGFKKSLTNKKLLIITNLDKGRYSRKVAECCKSDPRIILYGPLYNKEKLAQMRANAFGYIHGHSVGGTNPSLVEAMGYGNIIVAHNNIFNKEVVSEKLGYFFKNENDLVQILNSLDNDPSLSKKREMIKKRVEASYNWESIAEEYINLFKSCLK